MTMENHAANDEKSAEHYTGELFGQLMQIDRVHSKEEIEAAVYRLLSLIGEAMDADRVFLFDRLEEEREENYSNTFEWCAEGVSPQIENLERLTRADMPVWLETFERGEPIYIPDLEEVRGVMPSEYDILKAQDIRREIAVPVFYRSTLSGFFGVGNPRGEITPAQIDLLSFVGGHVGSAREKLRMFALLEQKQKTLEQDLQAKLLEQQMLMVLCRNSISVYRVDLMKNRAQVVKVEDYANTADELLPYGDEIFPYYEAIRDYYERFVIKETAPDFLQALQTESLMRALENKDRISRRYRCTPNARGQIYFEVRVSKLLQTDTSFQVLVDFHNIDEIVREERQHQRELEAALAESRANYEVISAIGKIYYTIYRIDLRTKRYEEISGNSRMHRLTGGSGLAQDRMNEESRRSVLEEYLPYVESFFDLSTLGKRLKTEDSMAIEYPVKDGNWHLARFIVQTRDENGEAERVLFAMRLFSEEKRREKYWMSAAEEARRANEAKSEFLSRMSHDIRTPMNVIMGFANIARQHAGDPAKIQDCLDKILTSGQSLQALIDDVLDISRIESGEFRVVPQPMELHELFDSYSQAAHGMAAEKHLTFTGRMHDIKHDTLAADPVRMGQVYMNLLSNAVKYTPEGGTVDFEVYEEPAEEDGEIRLVSVVRDTGIGMTKEFMGEMYSAFARAVDTRVNRVRGSGLGLAIVKKIVDLMDGTIEVESKVGKGTTFRVTFTLPTAEEGSVRRDEVQEPVRLPARGVNVLVAEDNALNYEIVVEQLSSYGLHCRRAKDGRDCVRQFKRSQPGEIDVILMDMQMPEMNGLEATAAIRALARPDAKEIPIIALTANAYQEDVQRCLDAGMNAHLSKPIHVDRAVRTIAECLKKK